MAFLRPVNAELLGTRFRFQTGTGLFSADRIDDGTRLLLSHLPTGSPRSVLDMGCGYGALGLPVAARFPDARCLLVDRSLLAVRHAGANALAHRLGNVEVHASLGYREVAGARFDWILMNIPARIGEAALTHLLEEGAARLEEDGQLRAVVIHDLAATVERKAAELRWPLERCAASDQHSVFALPSRSRTTPLAEPDSLYLLDRVQLGELTLERPFDISEDPQHLEHGMPLLLDLLPRSNPGSALVWRAGYGAVAVTLARREAKVLAADPDLLATTFTRRNAAQASVTVRTREACSLQEAVGPDDRYNLIVGELTAGTDPGEVAADVQTSRTRLTPGGQALWLGLYRSAQRQGLQLSTLATRGPYGVWRVRSEVGAR